MARLPDRFDLFVRQARRCPDPLRQADYVLGALAALPAWHFLNVGAREQPRAAAVDLEEGPALLVFTDADRADEMIREKKLDLSVATIDQPAAIAWCLERRVALLVNPGDDAVLIPFDQLEAFHAEWIRRGAQMASGFWIPQMTTEEEDFWQEHGL